jgi:hypothetical protein
MRRVAVLLAVLALLMPLAAWANGMDIVNRNGIITLLETGITSDQSSLIQFNDIHAKPGHSLGRVDFTTGALTSGTLLGGGIFSSVGSSFVVTGNGTNGVPHGIIFNGAFVGDITWTLIAGLPNKPQVYELSGQIQGQLYTGRTVTGTTKQTIYLYRNQVMQDHKGNIHLGDANFNTPEPGTLGLMGAGLLAVAGMIRQRLGL